MNTVHRAASYGGLDNDISGASAHGGNYSVGRNRCNFRVACMTVFPVSVHYPYRFGGGEGFADLKGVGVKGGFAEVLYKGSKILAVKLGKA